MVTKEGIKEKLKSFIDKYNEYKKDKDFMNNERQVSNSLILPLFRDILGWDIEDPYEFKSEFGLGGKRIDYLVCIEGVSQFIIETKAASIDIKDNGEFYRQAIQYAEAKGKDFAILTNFRTFIILRAGIMTSGVYANEIRTIDILNLKDTDIDFLLYFNRNFWIEKGEENPLYLQKNLKRKKPLDERLVEEMTIWRDKLRNSLFKQNKYNFDNEKELEKIEEEVQRFIDRLIFICYCEDKQLHDNELKSFLKIYQDKHIGKIFLMPKIKDLFETYNQIYNSDLFKRGLCDEFNFDETVLNDVLEDLRGSIGGLPYDFSIIDADILGRAYENYLGHILSKKDEGKRKEMGIYYTPQYIVNYIVKNTVRERIKNLTSFNEILKIKIVDPACGSGSFLIKVFDVLLEESRIILKKELTYEQKKNLLLNCIYGVDLDERACDIAKLNLSLKLAARGEKLPALHNNIQNGNSLIDDEKIAGNKAFKWEERFPFKFDVVIGNPPYIKEYTNREIFETVKKSDMKKYYQGKMDFWYFFTCKALDLLKEHGLHSYIAQNNWVTSMGASILRNKVLLDSKIISFFDFNEFRVFKDASIQTMVFVLEKQKPSHAYLVDYYKIISKNISKAELINYLMTKKDGNKIEKFKAKINPTELKDKLIVFVNAQIGEIFEKMKKANVFYLTEKEITNGVQVQQEYVNKSHLKTLGDNFKVGEGVFVLSDDEKNRLNLSDKEKELIKPLFTTNEINRYKINDKNNYWVIYTSSKFKNPTEIKPYPNIKKHLDKFNNIITTDFKPYGIHRTREENFFKGEKIVSIRKCSVPSFSFVDFDSYVNQVYYVIKTSRINMKFLTGLLNSKLIYFWLYHNGKRQGEQLQIDRDPLIEIPIIQSENKDIIKSVDLLMDLNKKLESVNLEKRELIKSQIEDLEKTIDDEVYKLYGITKEEKKIIEESLK